MRQKMVAGNWKMHGDPVTNDALLGDVKAGLAGLAGIKVAVCPPFPFLGQVAGVLAGTGILLGAQTVSEHAQGAYTGEVSAPMLKALGVSFVLVGHSERRALFGETDQQVAEKFGAAQRSGLVPILCVGETLQQRESGNTAQVVCAQLSVVMDSLGVDALKNSVLAYEPVWAIGTGQTATPEQVQEVHALLRRTVAARNASVANELKILYGGSVKPANAAGLFSLPDVDGGLIGGASLVAEDFVSICRAAQI